MDVHTLSIIYCHKRGTEWKTQQGRNLTMRREMTIWTEQMDFKKEKND